MSQHELKITLHPEAQSLLFNQFALLSKIFNHVLGQLETDYVCIALLTEKNELLLFSSSPGDEWCLIDTDEWQAKKRFQSEFFSQEQVQTWSAAEHNRKYGLSLSISSLFDEYRVVYSFATKSRDKETHRFIESNIASLIRMGQFCLKAILEALPFLTKTRVEGVDVSMCIRQLVQWRDAEMVTKNSFSTNHFMCMRVND